MSSVNASAVLASILTLYVLPLNENSFLPAFLASAAAVLNALSSSTSASSTVASFVF
jgi:hypothetical protein